MIVAVEEAHHLVEDPLHFLQGLGVPFEMNLRTPSGNVGLGEGVLDLSEVDVVEAEEQEGIGAVNAQLFFGQRSRGGR